ncbi:LAQU0S18e01618g1_1 [Lachancea quebecensis]|uniref:LAQU0S18e01618g1_1 n=1 Tax=Lachancea quebecensis TaxID=1654605 RepID=A0A0P1KWZ6_9SACH|nr:LAQU0S18e01618g1_1 [Lachancea quebecensis]
MSTSRSGFKLWEYKPSVGAAAVFTVIFLLFVAIIWAEVIIISKRAKKRMSHTLGRKLEHADYHKSGFTRRKISLKYTCLIIGCVLETAGYIARIKSANSPEKMMPFIIQSVYILIAPSLTAASIYMVFGAMLILLECTSLSIVPAKHNTTFFVCGDVLSLLLQAGGGGLMIKQGSQTAGKCLAIAGLITQLIFFGLFLITEVRFLVLAPKKRIISPYLGNDWKVMNWALIISSILILIRCVVRTIEFIEGQSGYIATHEWTLYVFDALLMTAAIGTIAGTLPFANLHHLNIAKMALTQIEENGSDQMEESISDQKV